MKTITLELTQAIPSRAEQDIGIEELKHYLRFVHDGVGRNLPPGIVNSWASLELKHGRSFYMTPLTYRVPRMTKKACFRNCAHEAINERGVYVEGHVITHGVPIHHAWLTFDGETVIDPTISDPVQIGGYFGTAVKRDHLMQMLVKKRSYGLFDHENVELLRDTRGDWVHTFTKVQP